jgi:hypothetical protein
VPRTNCWSEASSSAKSCLCHKHDIQTVTSPNSITAPPRRKRPKSVTFLALAVLYLGMVNLARARLALDSQSFARTLSLAMPLPYLAAGALIWGVVFVVAAFGMWRLWPWARKLLLGAIIVYQLHIWINHLLFDTSNYARQVWPFYAGISLAWIVIVWGLLFLPGIRRHYQSR